MKPATFAPLTVLIRRMPRRISGSEWRIFQTTNPTTRTSDAAKKPTGQPASQPTRQKRREKDGQSGGGDDRREETLNGPCRNEGCLGPRESREEGGQGEDNEADEEDAPASEQVGGTPTEEQEPAEHERVCADHP